jgi:hypothetical protein
MSLARFWNYFTFGVLILSGLIFALFLFSGYSYQLMRFYFSVARSTTLPLIILSLTLTVVTALSFLDKKLYRKIANPWKIILWISIFTFSSLSFLGTFFTDYKVTASASFRNQKYYLIRFNYTDSYRYKLYSCESFGLLCRRSSEYIGILYQHDPISLKYDLKTHRVYIQNRDRSIQVSDQ